jgi:hypothetical protein
MKKEKIKEIYSREFKLNHFGYGDWMDEPDSIEFEFKGIKCFILRVVKEEPYAEEESYFGGHLCGYIFLPLGNPLYGEKWDEIDLDCHGGITWTADSELGYMVGFDCGHSCDLIPTTEHRRRTLPELIKIREMFPVPEGYEKFPLFNPTYKNISFCIKQCKSLVKQALKFNEVLK